MKGKVRLRLPLAFAWESSSKGSVRQANRNRDLLSPADFILSILNIKAHFGRVLMQIPYHVLIYFRLPTPLNQLFDQKD